MYIIILTRKTQLLIARLMQDNIIEMCLHYHLIYKCVKYFWNQY
jgi:hypothetical protein